MFRFQFIWAFLFIPVILFIFLRKRKMASINYSNIDIIRKSGIKKSVKHKIGSWLIMAGIIFLIAALARPQMVDVRENAQKFGIDIVMVMDVSGSMLSVDFKPNRLETAKQLTQEFISNRVNDRIGFVIFSGTAFTKTPLTTDYNILGKMIEQIQPGDVNKDGTAIGMGLAVAANRLKNSTAKSKVIILLTDGDNNAGTITPETAAELTKEMGIKVYTIGIGTDKTIIPKQGLFGVEYVTVSGGLNEALLKNISDSTGGDYFRARTGEDLKNIFDKIDQLEKTKIDIKNVFNYTEMYFMLAIAGLLFIAAGLMLEELFFIKIP